MCLYNTCHFKDSYEHIYIYIYIYIPALVLRPSLIPEEVGINKNDVPIRNNQPKGVEPKMRERELRSGVNWQRARNKQNSVVKY
jgi:hypothetical protein